MSTNIHIVHSVLLMTCTYMYMHVCKASGVDPVIGLYMVLHFLFSIIVCQVVAESSLDNNVEGRVLPLLVVN